MYPLLVQRLTLECGFDYLLTSRIQNDPLEHHFGQYRQISSSNYNISYCQILESGRRLQISNLLKFCYINQQSDKISPEEYFYTFTQEDDEEMNPEFDYEFVGTATIFQVFKDTGFSLIEFLDRGSLKYPSEIIYQPVMIMYEIFLKLNNHSHLIKLFYERSCRRKLDQLSLFVVEESTVKYGDNGIFLYGSKQFILYGIQMFFLFLRNTKMEQ